MIDPNFINHFYSTRGEIAHELHRRRFDSKLKSKVFEFWGEYAPDFLHNDSMPYGFFSRPTITPNMELRFFLDIVKTFDVKPLLMEFPDRFATINKAKYHVAKPHMFCRTKEGKKNIIRKGLVDFNIWEGKPLSDVETKSGINLQTLHHDHFKAHYPNFNDEIIDISFWFDLVRKRMRSYYAGFLALGIYHGVIFENFLFNDPDELSFFEEKVIGSFKEVEDYFGLKPLIHPILPKDVEYLEHWYFYPDIKPYIFDM